MVSTEDEDIVDCILMLPENLLVYFSISFLTGPRAHVTTGIIAVFILNFYSKIFMFKEVFCRFQASDSIGEDRHVDGPFFPSCP